MKNTLSERLNLGKRLSGVTMPLRRKRTKWNRNWPCLCGSNKKYKRCCLKEIEQFAVFDGNATEDKIPENIQQMIVEYKKKEEEKQSKGKEEGKERSVINNV